VPRLVPFGRVVLSLLPIFGTKVGKSWDIGALPVLQHPLAATRFAIRNIRFLVPLAAVREDLPYVEQRIRALRRLAKQHEDELDAIADIGERTNRLVEISVVEQARLLSAASVVRDAVPRPSVHAWVFDIRNGFIRTLPCGPADERSDQGSYAVSGAKAVYGGLPASVLFARLRSGSAATNHSTAPDG
jgi:hypothetical protein